MFSPRQSQKETQVTNSTYIVPNLNPLTLREIQIGHGQLPSRWWRSLSKLRGLHLREAGTSPCTTQQLLLLTSPSVKKAQHLQEGAGFLFLLTGQAARITGQTLRLAGLITRSNRNEATLRAFLSWKWIFLCCGDSVTNHLQTVGRG